jgi:hypothetical protein
LRNRERSDGGTTSRAGMISTPKPADSSLPAKAEAPSNGRVMRTMGARCS